nr:MAG TPA: baseplate protein [Caudoviricetes sp.]
MTKAFEEVISGIRKAKKGVEVREDLAQMGEYCQQFTQEAGTRADAAKQSAETAATNAKASEKKATDAVAGIEQTKTDAVQAVQNAQTTATTAVQQAQTAATDAVTAKQTEAVQAVGNAKETALQEVADSTQDAQTAASNAAASEQAAGNAATAAGGYASSAKSSAIAASGSARAAATSESNAASSAQSAETDADRAEAAAELAGTRANTDKTLKTENAPADAAAVGAALDKKANADVIYDSKGNIIFYSKVAVDKLLAGKLDIKPDSAEGLGSGLEVDGAGKLGTSFYNRGHVTNANEAENPGWYSIPADATNAPIADAGQIVSLRAPGYVWPCQVFISSSINGLYCRTFNGTNWSAWMAAGIVASGSNYVRFGDGTQICWGIGSYVDGYITETNRRVNFPVAFVNNPAVIAASNANIGNTTVLVGWESTTGFTIGETSGNLRGNTNWIAIGRWK